MRAIFRLAGALLLLALPAQAGHSPPKVFLRVFVQTTGEGQPSTQAREIAIPPDNEKILIRAMPEVSEQDLVDVRTDASNNVHFYFDHRGQVDLDAATAQNQGRIMVVVLNGYIYYAPVIDEEISTGELVVPHPLSPVILQLLQATAKQNVRQSRAQ
jgi:preprotein translocase subunit SecD